jgi:CBS domain-containing protein
MRAREIMTANPACVTADDSIADAARLMEECDCGCIPVTRAKDDACVVGVITDRDIAVRGVAHGRGPDASVRELMTAAPYCCGPDADVRAVEDTMATRQVRRVVIVDDGGCCVGMVAQADIAGAAERGTEISDDEVGRIVERISEPSRELRL